MGDNAPRCNQPKEAFWVKITKLYNSRRGLYPERTLRSMQSRYDHIKTGVNKFASYYADAVRRNPSGTNDSDKTAMACAEFAQYEPQPFAYMHCWEIFKNHPKWQDTKHGRNVTYPEANDAAALGDEGNEENDADESIHTISTSGSKRPIGRDAAKRERKKAAGTSSSSGSDFAASMQGLMMSNRQETEGPRQARHNALLALRREEMEEATRREQAEREDARRCADMLFQVEQEKVQIEKQKVAIKEKRSEAETKKIELMYAQEEERILAMDLTKFQEPLHLYYEIVH